MTDTFHENVPDGWLMGLLTVMVRTPHTYQILTKRPTRMAEFFAKWGDLSGEPDDFCMPKDRRPAAVREAHPSGRGQLFAAYLETLGEPPEGAGYPSFDWMEGPRWWPTVLPNIWLGTSIEADRYAWRGKVLSEIPAAVHFVSAEPLLGPLPGLDMTGLDWIIAGGESGGPTDRRMVERCEHYLPDLGYTTIPQHCPRCASQPRDGFQTAGTGWRPKDEALDWVRDLRDRAVSAGVAFHFKQFGGPAHGSGGRLLDGRTWDEFPALRTARPTARGHL